jgi:hypothetical protein
VITKRIYFFRNHILHRLVEYILGPNFQEVDQLEKKDLKTISDLEREHELHVSRLPHDPNIPQMIFDCDSINVKKRFIYKEQTDNLCPGGCANSRPCKRVVEFFAGIAESIRPELADDENNYEDPEVKYIDIQSAWHELKILILWFYWALEQNLEDVSQIAIGFQVPCNCCSCAPINIISRLERLKYFDANSESETSEGKCTCKETEDPQNKSKVESNRKFKYLLKCPHCRNQGEIGMIFDTML